MLDQGLRSKRNSQVRLDTLMCVFSYFYGIENLYVLFHEKFISLSKGQWILKQNWQSVTSPKKWTNELVFLSWRLGNTWNLNFDFKFQVFPCHQDRKHIRPFVFREKLWLDDFVSRVIMPTKLLLAPSDFQTLRQACQVLSFSACQIF